MQCTGQDLIDVFSELEEIAYNLKEAVREYSRCFFNLKTLRLDESLFHETSDVQKKINIKRRIEQLEISIQTLYEEFLACTDKVSLKIKNCEFLDFDTINELNQKHFEIMMHYQNVIMEFKALQKLHKDQDFIILDFSKMERQKMQLNIAIKNCNAQLLGNCNVQLLDVFETEKEVRQFFLKEFGAAD